MLHDIHNCGAEDGHAVEHYCAHEKSIRCSENTDDNQINRYRPSSIIHDQNLVCLIMKGIVRTDDGGRLFPRLYTEEDI